MAVIKKKDVDWRYYLQEVASSGAKISDIERIEFAGYLLKRDLEEDNFAYIRDEEEFPILNKIASMLIAESPDTTFDLIQEIKTHIVNHYQEEMDYLIAEKEEELQEEKQKCDPRDEYDPCENDKIKIG